MPREVDPKARERCLQQMLDHAAGYPDPTAAAGVVAERNGVGAETVRRWYVRARVASGERRGATSAEPAEIRELRAEVRRLEDDVDILRRATVFLAWEPGPPGPLTAGVRRRVPRGSWARTGRWPGSAGSPPRGCTAGGR